MYVHLLISHHTGAISHTLSAQITVFMPVYRFVTATEIAKTQRPILHGRNMAGVIESKTRKKATKFAIGTRG